MIVPTICISSTNKRLDRAGLPLYDFGARWYNPATPAWTTPDPMAEKYYDFSPYAYCAGDPVNLVDPNGMEGVKEVDEKGNVTISSNVVVVLEKPLDIPENATEKQIKKINNKNERIKRRNSARLESITSFLSKEFADATSSDGKAVSFVFNISTVEVTKPSKLGLSEAIDIAVKYGITGVETPDRSPSQAGYGVATAAVIGQGNSGGALGLTKGHILISTNVFSSRTIAHEIGHTFHLPDNYPESRGGLMDYPAGPLSGHDVDNIIKKAYAKNNN